MARLNRIFRSSTGDAVTQAGIALAEAEHTRDTARAVLAQAERDRTDAMRAGLDGDVDAATLGRHRQAVVDAKSQLEDADQLVTLLHERKSVAKHNADAKARAALRAEFEKDINEGTAEIREAAACDQRKAGCLKRAWAALERARSMKQRLGIESWPSLWSREQLVRAGEIDLVRAAPEIFRYSLISHGQALSVADLETRHRSAVAEVLPDNPQPRPVAA